MKKVAKVVMLALVLAPVAFLGGCAKRCCGTPCASSPCEKPCASPCERMERECGGK